MNMDDKTTGCRSVEKYVTRLAQIFDENEIGVEDFCKNALIHLVLSDRKCWLPVIRSLTPKIQSVLHAYCTATIGEGYEPPAHWCLPGNATVEELNAKRAEMLPEYMAFAKVIADHSAPK